MNDIQQPKIADQRNILLQISNFASGNIPLLLNVARAGEVTLGQVSAISKIIDGHCPRSVKLAADTIADICL